MPKLTKRLIDGLEPDPDAEQFLWDGELKGFGVRMMPTGIASYILKYRNAEGRQRKMTLGRVGTLTPEEARGLAREKLAEVFKGADPSADRSKLRKSITIAELCDTYLIEAKIHMKASTWAMDKSRIESHVKPLLGRRSVVSLTSADVVKMQSDIIAGKTAKKREGRGGATTGGSGVAGRTVGMLGTILEFARRNGVVSENVARGVRKPKDRRQKRFLSYAEIGRLGTAMREAETESPTALAAICFLLLSGCRRMEVLSLPEAWIDPDAGCIRFGDTKGGYQIRPIGKSAFKVIEHLPSKNGWVFPADRGDSHFVGLPRVLDRLCAKANLEDVTIHVLRHTFASVAAEMGYSELTIAGLLGHSVPGVTARYAHVADTALVAAADKVSERIEQALAGTAQNVAGQ